MAPTVLNGGQAVARALAAHGVDLVFGLPGTHNLDIYAHLTANGIRHIAPRHEQGAGYAADAYARVTGRAGVALTTTGPALMNIAAAVGQAYSDSVPLLVVSPGMPTRHPRLPSGMLHEMHSQTQAMAAVAAFSHRVSSVAEIGVAVARAFTMFGGGRPRPAHIEVPLDLLTAAEPCGEAPVAATPNPVVPPADSLSRAAETLLGADSPVLILGGGARRAAHTCLALAERLQAPVVTTANGKGVVDEIHPLSLGVGLHTPAIQRMLADCDVVFAIGTELSQSDYWCDPPRPGGTLIRLDVDPAQLYSGHAADVPLAGDAKATLDALLPLLGAGECERRDLSTLRAERDHATADRDSRWIPYLRAIREVLAPDAVITSDSAMCCYYGALPHLPIPPNGRYLHPTGFGTLGYALPAAIGAKAADPARQVLALSGDGGLQFSVQELGTASQLGAPLPIVVFDNAGYGEIRDEMKARGDAPLAVDLSSPDLPAIARAYGGRGMRADTPQTLASAVREALATAGPTLIVVPEEQ